MKLISYVKCFVCLQAKNGTKNAITPSLKLSALATAGAAGQIAVPNPGPRAAERSGNVTVIK